MNGGSRQIPLSYNKEETNAMLLENKHLCRSQPEIDNTKTFEAYYINVTDSGQISQTEQMKQYHM